MLACYFLRILMCKNALQDLCTLCEMIIHSALLLTGRPGKTASGKNVEVYVEDGLTCTGTVIDDQAVTLGI